MTHVEVISDFGARRVDPPAQHDERRVRRPKMACIVMTSPKDDDCFLFLRFDLVVSELPFR